MASSANSILQSATWCRSKVARQASVIACQARYITYDKLENKKITRIESEIEIKDDPQFPARVINRNPRNLEQLCFEHKPQGFWLEKKPPLHWYKVSFERVGKHLEAALVHWSGRKVVQASTKEEHQAKYFKNRSPVTIGQIFAKRCLQSGYINGVADFDAEAQNDDNVTKSFYDALTENGFTLEELPAIQPRTISDL